MKRKGKERCGEERKGVERGVEKCEGRRGKVWREEWRSVKRGVVQERSGAKPVTV